MNSKVSLKVSKKILAVLLLGYTVLMVYLLFFSPVCGRTRGMRNHNLLPLNTLVQLLLRSNGWDSILLNIMGNIGLFLPFAFFLSLLRKTFPLQESVPLLILKGALLSLAVETIQWIFVLGIFDVDDILLNCLGFTLGWLWARRVIIPDVIWEKP